MTFPARTFLAAGLAVLVAFTGCVRREPTPALAAANPAEGYYFHTKSRPNNASDTLFVLCFSGGGTRAAALSYGVLEELRRTRIGTGDIRRRLLDEIDVISSVSGGSVTAAAFTLYGEDLFPRFERDFLKFNIQRQIVGRTLNPFRWNKLLSKTYGRSDIAAELYDERLFHDATFSDLVARPGAFAVMNATDISTGARFSFTQYQFDLICGNLAPMRISRAVAASSAVPGLLSPITLNNKAGNCNAWIPDADAARRLATNRALAGRGQVHVREIAGYLNSSNRPFLHLVDGGVSDNLGVRAVLDGLFAIEANPDIRDLFDMKAVRRVAIVVVNAYSSPEKDWDRREEPPGTLQLALSSAAIPMDRYSAETLELLREQLARWRDLAKAGSRLPSATELQFFPVEISFFGIPDPEERRYFLNQPTSFHLPDEAVDRLREVGGRLLRDSPDFRAFVRDFSAPAAGR